MPFNVRLATMTTRGPRDARHGAPLPCSVASFIEGALFAFGVMFMVAIMLWILSVSGVLGDPLVPASWSKLG